MLIAILFAAWLLIFLSSSSRHEHWRKAFLTSSLLFSGILVLMTEILSAFQLLNRLSLSLAWLSVIIVVLVWGLKYGRLKIEAIRTWRFPAPGSDRVLWISIAGILLLTLAVALVSPPNNYDSLSYHMSRVAHWAQNQSVQHYPTNIARQIFFSPGAEYIAAHIYILSQGDLWVNLVQWFSMLGCVLGVTQIATQLGASRAGQAAAAAFAVSLPLGVLEASSTQVDYVLAFWIVAVISLAIERMSEADVWQDWVYLGLGVGLAVLTKGTAVIYLIPVALWLGGVGLKRNGFWWAVKWGGLVVLLVLLLNGGHLLRNWITYEDLLGPNDIVSRHVNEKISLGGLTSNLIRNISLHLGTPFRVVNDWHYALVQSIHNALGLDLDNRQYSFMSFRIFASVPNEDFSGNPLHLVLIAVTYLVLLFKRHDFSKTLRQYSLLLPATFILLALLYKWQAFGTRLQLSLFVIAAPFYGLVFSRWLNAERLKVMNVLLVAACLPWLLFNQQRPVIHVPDVTFSRSVFLEKRQSLYFNAVPEFHKITTIAVEEVTTLSLEEITALSIEEINASACREIGVRFGADQPEYLFWALLDFPRTDMNIRWVSVGGPTAKFVDESFQPCVVLCTTCKDDLTELYDLPVFYRDGNFKIYKASE
jgi:hypothetical protein